MKLKWTRERSSWFCYDEEDGRILAEVYERTLTGHCTASLILLDTHEYEPYGEWINVEHAQKAVETQLRLRNSTTIGIC